MELNINNRLFVVTGATSGLGKGVADALLNEGASLIVVARDEAKLVAFANQYPGSIEVLAGDITKSDTIHELLTLIGDRSIDGLLVNAGGPPAKSFMETDLSDWDVAYNNILRWKVELTKLLLPKFLSRKYGRIVYIESSSVKQPVENLVLSNSLRLGVVGFVKTLSQEVASQGVTLNILAPGFHNTPAAERLFIKRSEVEGITIEAARHRYESEIKVGRMGNPVEFGKLAAFLLSPLSGYMTGQTINMDGGANKGTMG
ncbi:MAG: SDR family oxidoreductase [Bacteroidales bacterium]